MNIQFIRLGLLDEGGNPMPRSKFIPTGSDHESSPEVIDHESEVNQKPEVTQSTKAEVQPEFRPVLPSSSSIRRSGPSEPSGRPSSNAPSSDGTSPDSRNSKDYPSSSANYISTSAKVVWILFCMLPVRCARFTQDRPEDNDLDGSRVIGRPGIILTAGDTSADSLEEVTFLIIGDFDPYPVKIHLPHF